MNKKLSIIMPAFKAQDSIAESLKHLNKVLKEKNFDYQIILVVDGKVDDTYKIAKGLKKKIKKLRVFTYNKNKGKGYAVRFGMAKAKGQLIGFIDEGEEIKAISLISLIEVFEKRHADIVVGSKRHKASKVTYPFLRKLISDIYALEIKLLFDFEVKDTQAGVKLYSKRVIDKILPELEINGFAFDIEMFLASKRAGFNKIYEAPIIVEKKLGNQSSIGDFSFFKAALFVFFDTLKLFLKYRMK